MSETNPVNLNISVTLEIHTYSIVSTKKNKTTRINIFSRRSLTM